MKPYRTLLLFSLIAMAGACAKASVDSKPSTGGSSAGSGGTSATGGASATGGVPATGGQGQGGAATGGSSSTGGASKTGGAAKTGGSSSTGGGSATGGSTGGSTATGGVPATGGAAIPAGPVNMGCPTPVNLPPSTGGVPASASVSYKLPPPDQCHDQDFVPYEVCQSGVATSQCGGKCQVINACAESTTTKPNADVTFMCPRMLLFSAEMEQAVADDGNTGFHYAVVGHDADKGGIDGDDQSTCCQCYQLVYAYPSPRNDRQALLDPDHPEPPVSALPIPPPLIVQAFNTAATPQTFDVYMPAGGLGANNACAPVAGSTSASGQYMYTSYPALGQPSQGGLKPASILPECRTKDKNWLTTDSLCEPACQQKVVDECGKIASTIPGLTEQSRANCVRTNNIKSFYHLNWSVYAMKVECPENLTRVTGCKLAPQGLPAVKKDVTTAEAAAKDSAFWKKTGSTSNLYETTTMEDCCRPSCSAINWISGRGLKPDPDYRAFYTCDAKGVPYTQ